MNARLLRSCPNCGTKHLRSHPYCLSCHAANMREWRKTHPLNALQRFKDTARSYANVYKQRGKLTPEPCAECGSKHAEMHHDDYAQPLAVTWLCRPCHLALHRDEVGRAAYA